MNHKLRIVFMGTPDFAVPSLDILYRNGFTIAGVVTAPDKPAGRGMQLQASPVKKYALEKGLTILQPTNLKSQEFQNELRSLKADIQIIVAFRMLPETVWNMPALGSVNLHASLLPDYRGAAPINWAIINGEKETGISTFFLQHEIDTGKIIFMDKVSIDDEMTAGELHDVLMERGGQLILRTIEAIESGSYPQIEQGQPSEGKSAPKLNRENCRISWDQPIEMIRNQVRGLCPYPAAWCTLNGKQFKIYKVRIHSAKHDKPCGSTDSDNKSYVRVYAPDGYVELLELQMEGKKKMEVTEFLRGHKI